MGADASDMGVTCWHSADWTVTWPVLVQCGVFEGAVMGDPQLLVAYKKSARRENEFFRLITCCHWSAGDLATRHKLA